MWDLFRDGKRDVDDELLGAHPLWEHSEHNGPKYPCPQIFSKARHKSTLNNLNMVSLLASHSIMITFLMISICACFQACV